MPQFAMTWQITDPTGVDDMLTAILNDPGSMVAQEALLPHVPEVYRRYLEHDYLAKHLKSVFHPATIHFWNDAQGQPWLTATMQLVSVGVDDDALKRFRDESERRMEDIRSRIKARK